jgi:BCD family chlorophyll transporter-like MFS transporter
VFGWVLADFSEFRLIQVIQGAAAVTMVLNVVALWKQEARDPSRTRRDSVRPRFADAWKAFADRPGARRFLIATGMGTAAFTMQDVVLEPYGGQVLNLAVSSTTQLTALAAAGALAAFALAARRLGRGGDPLRLAAAGAVLGLPAFAAVALAAPTESAALFRLGTILIGFGGGLFAVGTLTSAMGMDEGGQSGLALGAWGAVQATAAGIGISLGGVIRDTAGMAADDGLLGPVLVGPAVGYGAVYTLELVLLFATLAALGPLARHRRPANRTTDGRFGLAELPG